LAAPKRYGQQEILLRHSHGNSLLLRCCRIRFGFFMPFGAKKSFFNRLKCSPMLRHFFVHDEHFADELWDRTLTDESPSPKVTVADVDSAVNNCALICALLLSIPTGVISNLSEDAFVNMM